MSTDPLAIWAATEAAPEPFDITLGTVGLFLLPSETTDYLGETAKVLYKEPEMPWMPSQLVTGAQSFSNYDVRREGVWDIDSLDLGYGESRQGASKGRYLYAEMDCRVPGEVIPPPLITSVTGPNVGANRLYLTEFNSDLYSAVGANLEVSTDGGAVWTSVSTRSATITSLAVYRGAQTADLLFIGLGNSTAYETYNASAFTAFTGDTPLPTNGQFTIDNGATYTDNTTNVTDGQPGTSMAINALGTLAAEDWVIIGYTSPFVGLVVDVGNTNGNAATVAVHYNSDPTNPATWTAVSGLSDGTASGGATLAADGNITWTLPEPWYQHNLGGSTKVTGYHVRVSVSAALDASVSILQINVMRQTQAQRFSAVGSALYRVLNGNQVMITESGGAQASYGTITKVGDATTAVNVIISVGETTDTGFEERAYAVKTDGVYTSTATGTVAWLRVVDFLVNANSGIGAARWHVDKAVYVPVANGLFRFVDKRFEPVGPELIGPNDSPVRGEITAVAGDSYYLYAFVQTQAGVTWLLSWGVYLPQDDGTTRFLPIWHTLKNLGSVTVRTALVTTTDTGGAARLIFGRSADAGYCVVSNESPNRRLDTQSTFAQTSSLYWSRFDGGFKSEEKAYLGFSGVIEGWNVATAAAALLENVGDVRVSYRLAPTDSFTTVGTWSTSTDAVRRDFASNLSGRFIDIWVELLSDSGTVIPVLRSQAMHWALRNKFKREPVFRATRGPFSITHDNVLLDAENERSIKTLIHNARKTATAVTLATPDGETVLVLFNWVQRELVQVPVQRAEARGLGREGRQEFRAWIWTFQVSEYRVSSVAGTLEALGPFSLQALSGYTLTALSTL